MINLKIVSCLTLAITIDLVMGYEYNSTMPLPPVMLSRNANFSKPRLVIPFFVEFYQATMMYVPLQTQLILDTIKPIVPYLNDFELEINLYDTFCDDAPALKATMAVLENGVRNLPFISSYACAMNGQKLLAEVINYYNYTASGLLDVVNDAVVNRKRFRNYFTLGATIEDMQSAMLKFIKTQNWTRVAMFGEEQLVYYKEWNRVLLPKLAKNKIDLIWFEQVPYIRNYNDADWRLAMESLIAVDPRVIIYNGESGYAPLCWFARYKLYGPNYAIILIHWVDSNTETIEIPSYIKHWCTVDMVRLSLNSSFVYGETGKANLFPYKRDALNLTGMGMERELLRVQDIENIAWLHNKYSFYDCLLFACSMLNEAERLLREQNDSLINWSVGSANFKQNGGHIVNVMKEAIFNIRVVGLRGDYQFYKNTSLNTGGGTPTPIYQCRTNENNNRQERPVVFDGSQLGPKEIIWQTGYPPYDRVQIVKYQVRTYRIEAIIVLDVMAAFVILLMFGIIVFKKPIMTLESSLLAFGVLVANVAIFLLALLDMEPVALHCSIVSTLFGTGISLCFLGIWLVLERQLKSHNLFSVQLKTKEDISAPPEVATSRVEKILIGILMFTLILLTVLLIIARPFEALKSEATLEMTFGKRHVELSTQMECKLAFDIFSMVVLGMAIGINFLIVLKSIFVAYEIRLIKKGTTSMLKLLLLRTRSKQLKHPKDNVTILIIFVTLMIATILLLLLIGQFAAYVTAATSMLFGLAVSFKLWFHGNAVG